MKNWGCLKYNENEFLAVPGREKNCRIRTCLSIKSYSVRRFFFLKKGNKITKGAILKAWRLRKGIVTSDLKRIPKESIQQCREAKQRMMGKSFKFKEIILYVVRLECKKVFCDTGLVSFLTHLTHTHTYILLNAYVYHLYIYIYIHITHTHTHTYIYIYIYIYHS